MSTTTGTLKAVGGLIAGSSGSTITFIKKGTVTVDLDSLDTVTAADKTLTITGAVAGDIVILCPPATAMTAGLLVCQAWVSAADEVKVRVYNGSGGTINEASATWAYTLIRS